MKRKYRLLKILLVAAAFVACGLIYSLSRSAEGAVPSGSVLIEPEGETLDVTSEVTEETVTLEETTVHLICIHICGAVRQPGVYFPEEGSRIYQAVDMAGGLLEDAAEEYINLADHLEDGMQVYIPFDGEDYSPEKASGDGLVNINTAGAGELMTLPGIGQTKADAIISFRESNGPFASVEDITNVAGIKENTFEKIKEYIKVQ